MALTYAAKTKKNVGQTILSIYIFVFHLNVWPLSPKTEKITLGIYRLLSLQKKNSEQKKKNNRILPQNIIIDDSKVVSIFFYIILFNHAEYNLPMII